MIKNDNILRSPNPKFDYSSEIYGSQSLFTRTPQLLVRRREFGIAWYRTVVRTYILFQKSVQALESNFTKTSF